MNQGVFFKKSYLFLMLGLLSQVTLIPSLSLADEWDLGYSNSSPEVEEIPQSIEQGLEGEQKADILEINDIEDEIEPINEVPAYASISTAKKTYGVDTVERSGLKFFVSPVAGFSSILGNQTVDVSPQYSFGGRAGFLFSDQLMVEAGYAYSKINTSAPLNPLLGIQPTDVFGMKQGSLDAGIKFFFLGRESRFRPFIGGAFGYSNTDLNYLLAESGISGLGEAYQMKQFQGVGQVGAEVGITRSIVLTAAFKLNGVLSSKTSFARSTGFTSGLDSAKIQVGDSLSRSASYAGTLGLGIYF